MAKRVTDPAASEASAASSASRSWRRVGVTLAIAVFVNLVVIPRVVRLAKVGAGLGAKGLCSGVFVSGRDAAAVWQDNPLELRLLVSYEVDADAQAVHATGLLGVARATAVFAGRHGCRIAYPGADHGPPFEPMPHDALVARATEPWPQGEAGASDGAAPTVLDKVGAIVRSEMARGVGTHAIVVVHRGHVVGEAYAGELGITAETRLQGWSMTKSVLSAVVGRLATLKGGVGLDELLRQRVPEWHDEADPRGRITLSHLMNGTSGLEFDETYGPLDDPAVMLFSHADAAAYAAAKPLVHAPGTSWSYSSGATNIVARLLRQHHFAGDADYWRFPHAELFEPIGAHSMVIETDASGTHVMSSFSYATARDWARFGMLYLARGVWAGRTLISPEWVDMSAKAEPLSGGVYGSLWWLARNAATADGVHPYWGWHKGLPEDLFRAAGHDEQYVIVVPSAELVIVRLGYTPGGSRAWGPGDFIARVLRAVTEA